MKRTLLAATAAIATSIALSTSAAYAATITFEAPLSGTLEVPPTGSPGTGFATVVLNTTAQTLFVDVTFSGLTGGTTASHIHCCVASPFLNANAGVATQVPSFVNLPMGVTSGTFTQTLDFALQVVVSRQLGDISRLQFDRIQMIAQVVIQLTNEFRHCRPLKVYL